MEDGRCVFSGKLIIALPTHNVKVKCLLLSLPKFFFPEKTPDARATAPASPAPTLMFVSENMQSGIYTRSRL